MNGKSARRARKAAASTMLPAETEYTLEPTTRRAHGLEDGAPTYHTATILMAECQRRTVKYIKRQMRHEN